MRMDVDINSSRLLIDNNGGRDVYRTVSCRIQVNSTNANGCRVDSYSIRLLNKDNDDDDDDNNDDNDDDVSDVYRTVSRRTLVNSTRVSLYGEWSDNLIW